MERPHTFTRPGNRASFVFGHVDLLWALPCPDIYISGATHCNLVFLPKCLIIICSILCELCRARNCSHSRGTGPHMLPVMWTGFGLYPVRIFTFPEQYIVIWSSCQNVLLSFVLFSVSYVEPTTVHMIGEPGRICFRSCGPAFGFTLSGYLHFLSNTL
jgi:hypothetical protein